MATAAVVTGYGKQGAKAAGQCAYYIWSGVRNATLYPGGPNESSGAGPATGPEFYKQFNCINVYGDNDVQWGEGWQELRGAQQFATWYLTVDNWHGATAQTLRCGMGGVQHMATRMQQLTVQLAQAEQLLQSTQRLRASEARALELQKEVVDEQADFLKEQEEVLQAKVNKARREKAELGAKVLDLEVKLAASMREKAALLKEAKPAEAEAVHALQEARRDLEKMQTDFENQKVAAQVSLGELEVHVLAANQKAEQAAQQTVEAQERVKKLEQELREKQLEATGEASQAPCTCAVLLRAVGVPAVMSVNAYAPVPGPQARVCERAGFCGHAS